MTLKYPKSEFEHESYFAFQGLPFKPIKLIWVAKNLKNKLC